MTEPSSASGPRRGGWRLASAPSLYLRSASEQAIDWHPWGEEPFELARRLKKPVLLDIGAAWCHWCHVMDETTYADDEVARRLNEEFVAVKVDRDENPEVDRRYQQQVHALSGEGGWPLTVFVFPDGRAFLGGTFFPPTDGHGRPGFRRLLSEVARLWRERPGTFEENASKVRSSLDRIAERSPPSGPGLASFAASVREHILDSVDPRNGGFGFAPKFPHPTAIELLLVDAFVDGDARAREAAEATLTSMANGGVYDQVGDGFHRYSVDEGWHIPHFEKMAVDNAALLGAYADGARAIPRDRFLDVIRGIHAWTLATLADPAGGFGASQDADNAPGDDGSFFTWSRPELKAVLDPDELRLVTRFFGVGTDGTMPHDADRNVLFRLVPLEEAAAGSAQPEAAAASLANALAKLRAARERRHAPAVDRALYASINGSYVRSLARAAPFLPNGRALADARAAADRFLTNAFDPARGVAHRLTPHGASGFGILDDQAEFALGLVELAGATAEPRYAQAAGDLLTVVDREYRGAVGLLRDVSPALYDGPKTGGISEAIYPLEDSPHLSANSAVALAAIRLGSLSGEEKWVDLARSLLVPISARLDGAGLFGAGAAWAARLVDLPAARVVVEGSGPRADALWASARRSPHPNLWAFRETPPAELGGAGALSTGSAGREPRALVCFGTHCLAPIDDARTLTEALAKLPA